MRKSVLWFFGISCLLVMVTSGCKTEDTTFDITGTWNFNLNYGGMDIYTGTITFTGSPSGGSLSASIPNWGPGPGTYTVDGTAVDFTINWTSWGFSTHCTGVSTDDNAMNGTFQETSSSGTWSADR